MNCGACNNWCPGSQKCEAGKCVADSGAGGGDEAPPSETGPADPPASTCAAGLTQCVNSGCSDLQNDVMNCGECNNWCPGSQKCQAGKCVADPEAGGNEPPATSRTQDPAPPPTPTADPPAPQPTDTDIQPGTPCGPGGQHEYCVRVIGGVTSAVCADFKTDPLNCGGCGGRVSPTEDAS
jgi:hypothetical protein